MKATRYVNYTKLRSSVRNIAKFPIIILNNYEQRRSSNNTLKTGIIAAISESSRKTLEKLNIKIVVARLLVLYLRRTLKKSKERYKDVWSVMKMVNVSVSLNTCKIFKKKVVWLTYNFMEWLLFPAATDDSLRNLKAGKKKEREPWKLIFCKCCAQDHKLDKDSEKSANVSKKKQNKKR